MWHCHASECTVNPQNGSVRVLKSVPSYLKAKVISEGSIISITTYDSRAIIIRIFMRLCEVRGSCILCLKHLWWYVISRTGNLTEEKSRVFNEISRMALLRITVYILHNLTLTSAKSATNFVLGSNVVSADDTHQKMFWTEYRRHEEDDKCIGFMWDMRFSRG
jgi:hypothetical protein